MTEPSGSEPHGAAGALNREDSLRAKFEVLEAVGLAIAAPSPMETVVELVLDLLLQAVPAEAATIFLLDPSENTLRFTVTRGPHPEILQGLLLPLNQGIVGWVVRENHHAVVLDVASDPRFASWVDEKTGFETRSVLCVPLRTRRGVIGAVELLNRKEGEFSEEEAVYVTSIANQTAQLIENVRLFQEQERALSTMQALGLAARWLNSDLNIRSVLENIVRTADKVIQAEAGSILLLDEEGHLHFEVALGPSAAQLLENKDLINAQLDEGIAGWVARHGEPVLIPDCAQDPRFTSGPGPKISTQIGFANRNILCVPMRSRDKVIGVVELINKIGDQPFDQRDLAALSVFADDAAAALTNARLYESLSQSYLETIDSLAMALDTRDNETGGHSQRVALYAQEVARQLGLSEDEVDMVYKGSLLHDIGKIGIPDAILRKPGKLGEDDWRIMRRHATIGYFIVGSVAFLRGPAVIPLFHHERYDGKGYPAGLKGQEIPLGARIFAVVDTFDAMTSDRPYRPALSDEAARQEIRQCSGTQFDPEVVEAFLRIPDETIRAIRAHVLEFQTTRPSLRPDEGSGEEDAAIARTIYEKLGESEG